LLRGVLCSGASHSLCHTRVGESLLTVGDLLTRGRSGGPRRPHHEEPEQSGGTDAAGEERKKNDGLGEQ
jgi:hypothetical protein